MHKDYPLNVFVNCPFDDEYESIRSAIIFTIFDCGFIPKCALEEEDSGVVRFDKIKKLIEISKFGIHDISRTELDKINKLPRFNMPLELGVFIGAKEFGDEDQEQKITLILDKEPHRYQKFMSDIAGQDIKSHNNHPEEAISQIRNWLNDKLGKKTIPGGIEIYNRYRKFLMEMKNICQELKLRPEEVTYNDYTNFISDWLKENLSLL